MPEGRTPVVAATIPSLHGVPIGWSLSFETHCFNCWELWTARRRVIVFFLPFAFLIVASPFLARHQNQNWLYQWKFPSGPVLNININFQPGLREPLEFFWVYLGFCPNRLDPRPPPQTMGMFILHFRLFKAYYFFLHEKVPLFGWKGLGLGNPTPYCDKIPTKSPCGFGLKKLGLGQTPAPLVGTKSQVNPIFFSKGSP